ncbi:MAG: LysR family transcriptional regulator [Planctomycetes bacterium]|nr:LysR family transcriptional regulator [Planctomycetota bacterium]
MNIEVMKTFCDLIETGSFSKAAEINYVSQSAVSQQLAKIERDLSTQLVSRGGGIVIPTEAGKVFLKGARDIIRRHEELLSEIKSASSTIRGVLRVGTIYSVGFYLLEPYVRKFLQAHPDVSLHVEYARANRIYASIIGGEMNIGVVACPEKHRSIEVIPLAGEELVVAFDPRHEFASRQVIHPQDLNGQKFVAFEPSLPTRRHIDKLLKKSHVNVNVVLEFDNIELVKRAVEIRAGLSILPLENVKHEASLGDILYRRIESPRKWLRPLGIVRRRGTAPGPAERMFLSILRGKTESASPLG